jgi:orotidine-5'-phosphate decarboxylase
MTALEKLAARAAERKHVCVGLDVDRAKIPSRLLQTDDPTIEFARAIVDATKPHAAAYKLNFAFYEAEGIEGWRALRETILHIKEAAPGALLIADAKRGDIGNTSKKYAQSLFDYFGADASTLHPYMGVDSLAPFFDYADKLNFALALTSNPSAADFEKRTLDDGTPLYRAVIAKAKEWNERKNVGLVFGATQLEELKENAPLFGELPVLIPGVGAQGGDLDAVVEAMLEAGVRNFLINSSRGVIYRSDGEDYAEQAAAEVRRMNDAIDAVYRNVGA